MFNILKFQKKLGREIFKPYKNQISYHKILLDFDHNISICLPTATVHRKEGAKSYSYRDSLTKITTYKSMRI